MHKDSVVTIAAAFSETTQSVQTDWTCRHSNAVMLSHAFQTGKISTKTCIFFHQIRCALPVAIIVVCVIHFSGVIVK